MTATPMTPPTAPNARTGLAQAVSRRVLHSWTTPRGDWQSRDLESLRDQLRQRRADQAPVEHSRTAAQAHLRFGDGSRRAEIAFLKPGGLDEPMLLTNHALRQLGREILPGRGLDFLLEQIELGEQGRKLADMSWALFAREKNDPRMFRTVMVDDVVTGKRQRAVRSLHSMGYAAYDNLEMVEDLLAAGYASMPLISVLETDESMRLRFALAAPNLADKEIALRTPVPMVEAWNSEVGLRSVQIKPGSFRLICTNGMGTFESDKTFRWVHTGDRTRIQTGVKDALTEVKVAASGTVDAYVRALDVGIEDAYAWFERAVAGEELGQGDRDAVKAALHHETTTPGGRLASVVDAVTLIAQDAIDEFQQERLEQVGVRLLRRGLSESLRGPLHA